MAQGNRMAIARHLAKVSGLLRHKGLVALLKSSDSRFSHAFIGALHHKLSANFMRQLKYTTDLTVRECVAMSEAELLNHVADTIQHSALALEPSLKKSAFSFKVPRKSTFMSESFSALKDTDQLRYDLAELNAGGYLISGMSIYATEVLYQLRVFIVASHVLRTETHIPFYERLLKHALDKGADYWLRSQYHLDVLVHDYDLCCHPESQLLAVGLERNYISSMVAIEGGLVSVSDLEAKDMDILLV